MQLVDAGAGSKIFWTAEEVLDLARVLVNDAQGGISGQDLADNRPYTWPLLNLCYGVLSAELEDTNVESATYAEAIITLPSNSSFGGDPAAQARLGYDGFSVGVGIDPAGGFTFEDPTLPLDLLEPLFLWERPSGQNCRFRDMHQRLGGLGSRYGGTYREWEFRQNSIYLLGGSWTNIDLRIRYIPSIPLLTKPAEGQPSPTIWFARAGEALAYMVAAEYAEIRNAANQVGLRAKADKLVEILSNKAAKRTSNSQTRRRGYGFGRRRRNGRL